ncbi:hypothetical protein ACIRLA_46395 [Streptomyces sp. NPDC102364]|uniref:hypothetical protein n=1 Tax=Streptomyces sp. NPDC102364 TaxID=3366161 RepID=UPI0038090460
MTAVLGCADQYSARIMWRGGNGVFMVPQLDQITAITWNRKLNDTSTAEITIALNGASADCCTQLGQVTEWCHELWIYRDEECVWQGPIVTPTYGRDSVTFTANDVTAWLSLLANYVDINYKGYDATYIAERIIMRNLVASLSTPKDYPVMLDYIVREDCGSKPTYRKGKWIEYVLEIIKDLTDYGFQFTAVGRSLYLRDIKTQAARTQGRLTGEDLLGDGVTVTRNGLGARTNGFATNQQANTDTGIYSGKAYVASTLNTPYGRLDGIATLSDQDATTAQLRAAALAVKGSRYPAPTVIDVSQNAQLSPTAPIDFAALVPGETFDIALADFCTPVQQQFRLTDVTGAWDGGAEKLGVSLSSLSITGDEEAA